MSYPKRLLRPQPPEFFSNENVIATLDRDNNIVHYNREIVDDLPWVEKRKVYYLEEPALEIATTDVWGFNHNII